jgi:hypothetical protein
VNQIGRFATHPRHTRSAPLRTPNGAPERPGGYQFVNQANLIAIYRELILPNQKWDMNVIAAAKAFNENAIQKNWKQFCDPTLAFTDECYTQLLALWREKAGTRPMPSRSQMTARDLKDFLRHISLVQREEENGVAHYRWRLIGTSVTQIVGHHTGKLFEDSVPPEHLSRWMQACNMILESGQPWRFLGQVQIHDREYLRAEHLYLPLADDNDVPSFVMGFCRYVSRIQDNELSEDEIASIPGGLF